MFKAPPFSSRATASALLLLLAACDCGGSNVGAPCTTSDECTGGNVCIDDRCARPTDGSTDGSTTDGSGDAAGDGSNMIDTSITSITLTPNPTTLDVTIGVPNSSLTFAVEAQLTAGGTMAITNASFSADNVSPGVFANGGQFFANGTIGGTVNVTATVVAPNGTFTANATLNVRLIATVGAGTGPTSPGAIFAGETPVTDAAADAEILYPLDGAVMPQNVQPADVQWACGAAGATCPNADLFRITITKPNLLVTQYVDNAAAGVNDHILTSALVWRAIAQTDPASDAVIQVDRYQSSMTRVVTGTPVDIRFAQAAITGTVYYWDIDDATIRYIDDGTSTSNILLPHIDSPEAAGDGDDCVGCHSVSPSGRYMLANTNFANYGALFDLTRADLGTANPTPTQWPGDTNIRWRMSTWSPDEDRAMVSTASGDDRLALINPMTGATVQAHDAAGANINLGENVNGEDVGTMPSWAPNDMNVAYIANNNSWAGQTTTGNLVRLPVVNSSLDRFGTVASIVASSVLDGRPEVGASATHGIFYPTWTPNSAWIAFAHGTSSRSDPRDANGDWAAPSFANTSALYLVRPNGTGLRRLDRGCTASAPEPEDGSVVGPAGRSGLDFQPNFAPFEGGGYFWLSFLSRRPYGNTLTGNLGTTIQPGQIWVMAVRMNADGTMDPSEVAYWLPGQDPDHRAVSAFWAPRPCRQNGAGCSVGSECCGGDCRPPVGGGAPVCSPPDPEECRQIGETCSTVADCCNSANDPSILCTGNVCESLIIIE